MPAAPIPWKHIRNVLVIFAPLWIGAVLVFGLIGVGYSMVAVEVYSARQPLVVRDEATGVVDRLGRFASQTELKAAQETLLEMVQNREVVADALKQVGPSKGTDSVDWPSLSDIDSAISDSVNILAPQGAEFGNTEVVYLQVQAEQGQRAVMLCNAVFDSLTKHLRDVRTVRADSVIIELTHARDLARDNLSEVTRRMQEIETHLGADLGELRSLNDTYSGSSSTQRSLALNKEQLQSAEIELQKLRSLHDLLVAGSKDPNRLLISGGDLLNSQPSLQRLKDGLIDAQLVSSQLSGIYTLQNPKRKAALATEREIRDRIVQESISVVEAMKPMMELQVALVERLSSLVDQTFEKLQRLAQARTSYAEIDSELARRTQQLAEVEERLVDAMATRSAALETNLIAALGPPQVSENPIGPGMTTLTFGSMMAGLIFGLGAVFLIAPAPTQSHGRRRWTDHVQGQNRRAEDRMRMAKQMQRRSGDQTDSERSGQTTPATNVDSGAGPGRRDGDRSDD